METIIHVRVSKLHNQLFFISNLSEWGPFCRKSYNELWLKNKPLKPEEKKALLKLANVLRKHEELYRLYAHIDPETTWKRLKTTLNCTEFNTLQTAYSALYARFEALWRRNEPELTKIQQTLLHSLVLARSLIRSLGLLYGISKTSSLVEIFLLTCPITKRAVSGGNGIGKNKIGIECSVITKHNNGKSQATRVVLHELIHTTFENKVKIKIEKFLKTLEFAETYERFLQQSATLRQTKSYMHVIKEMIAVSLLPEGYLAEKFFGLNIMKNLTERKAVREKKLQKTYYDLMLFTISELYKTAQIYTEHKRTIDSKFIREALHVWKTFEETDLSKYEFKKARN